MTKTTTDIADLPVGTTIHIITQSGSKHTGRITETGTEPPTTPIEIIPGSPPVPGHCHALLDPEDGEQLRLRQLTNDLGEPIDRITIERPNTTPNPPYSPHDWTEIATVEELTIESLR